MTTRGEALMLAILARLEGAFPGAVWRNRKAALRGVETAPALVLEETSETTTPGNCDRRQRHFAVVVYAAGEAPSAVADPVLETLLPLMVKAGSDLAGAKVAETGLAWEYEDAERTKVAVTVGYQLTYRTDPGSPAAVI